MLHPINNNYINFGKGFPIRLKPRLKARREKQLNDLIEQMIPVADEKTEPISRFTYNHTQSVRLRPVPGEEPVAAKYINDWGSHIFPKYCIFFHDGSGTVTNYQKFFEHLVSDNSVQVLAVEYPGFGNYKHIKGTYENIETTAKAAYDYLINNFKAKPEEINLVGHSFGATVAANLAKKVDCNSVTLISPITSISQLKRYFNKTTGVVSNTLTRVKNNILAAVRPRKYDSLNISENAGKIKGKIFVMSSCNDPITNIKWVDNLVKRIKKNGKQVTFLRDTEKGNEITRKNAGIISELMTSLD